MIGCDLTFSRIRKRQMGQIDVSSAQPIQQAICPHGISTILARSFRQTLHVLSSCKRRISSDPDSAEGVVEASSDLLEADSSSIARIDSTRISSLENPLPVTSYFL
ncbi:unnamed protein product [Clavelina lepadiformis]|uniref:Uncharacterized protein n=1 Tax=Clavelina lepadiformis TaxID=159417 RepID=A0ABP0H4M3_CLALP